MTSNEIRQKFLDFFEKRGHKIIPSTSLVPKDDASTLFISAGMQPLVPYLLGEKHPLGTRLANSQKCIRTGDIDDVGDNRHLTFFEMLGNWSLGDYFKDESIRWSFEFLTSKDEGLGLDKGRLYVTVFKGEGGIPRDDASVAVWKDVFDKNSLTSGVAGDDEMLKEETRIIPLGIDDNFWIAGATGPCGGDTEMFYDTKPELGPPAGKFSDLVNSFRFVEIWNNVFIEFNKTSDGKIEPLKQRSVDTGMGLERATAVVNGKDNVFDIDLFGGEQTREERIVADHVKAALFMIADGVKPENTGRGYVLRRLIRRAVRFSKDPLSNTVTRIKKIYEGVYKLDGGAEIENEERKFKETLDRGLKEFEKGTDPFVLFTTYGFPIELTEELAKERGIVIDRDDFDKKIIEHQKLSQTSSAGMFKGGLANTNEKTIKLHTAHHLLLSALQEVLGKDVKQKGSNITEERLRMDFSFDRKLTPEELKKTEEIVNFHIKADHNVTRREMPLIEAETLGAEMEFGAKYPEIVSLYFIEDKEGNAVSKEFCGGPHVSHTGELGFFSIIKEEAVSAGVRRIKAVLK
ncbi:MAG: hypothetical protein A2741_02900 [Candidatus Zambryskibacteria bacterium RIFCSPHIGHO2_01_FULL_43_27]|nr:MAG: hypothetical protein A2741_02900 [Candidatus Zambryskibacteria bacterium RIFCSPHIGHO2_01_FULL_43_27]OHB00764.1 MAG: hypothetical protein A3E93_02960 [Candidatus Zambryskibacteria bacterium RIFCSPHIGHO2_12_FULL_43_12b]